MSRRGTSYSSNILQCIALVYSITLGEAIPCKAAVVQAGVRVIAGGASRCCLMPCSVSAVTACARMCMGVGHGHRHALHLLQLLRVLAW